MKQCTFRDARAVWDDKILTISNAGFSRTYSLETPLLHALELKDASGKLFAVPAAAETDGDLYGYGYESQFKSWHLAECHAAVCERPEFEGGHLLVTLRYYDDYSHSLFTREFFIYPGLPMFGLRNQMRVKVIPNGQQLSRSALKDEYADFRRRGNPEAPRRMREPVVETLHPAEGFAPVLAVEFAGHTDVHDRPVREHKAVSGEGEYNGNLFFCEESSGAGVMILQEAPPSSERREYEPYDFRVTEKGDIFSIGWGVNSPEVEPDEIFVSYRNAVGVYHDASERDFLLKRYCRTRFDYGKERRGIVCNAWGCGKFGEKLCPEFLAAEVRGAAECGADSYQIDDQWQNGNLGDLSFRNKDLPLREFWKINPAKVENGSFDTLAELARQCGIELALWIAPSFNRRFDDWREFADMLLDFHRAYGFNLFKADGAHFSNYRAEQNFEKMLRAVRHESGGKVFFNLDVTAGMRGGYFKLLEYGNLFLENRYACHNWGVGYHPLRTLGNIWNLSKYVRLQYIQIEVAYPGDVNEKFYAARGESDPRTYSWEFWFAVAFLGNPLLWFSPSLTAPEDRPTAARMLALHKQYREEIFDSVISPVGDEPGAKALSGLVARSTEGEERFLVLFRGHEAEKSTFATNAAWQLLAGNAEIGSGTVTLPEKGDYAILKRK